MGKGVKSRGERRGLPRKGRRPEVEQIEPDRPSRAEQPGNLRRPPPGRVAPMMRSTDKHHRFPEPLFFRHRSRIDRIFISGVIDRPIFHACYQRAFVLELDRIRQEERAQVGQRQLAVSLRA